MHHDNPPITSGKRTGTLEPKDLLSQIAADAVTTPISSLSKSNKAGTTVGYDFDPTNPYYEYIDNPTPFTTDIDQLSAKRQTTGEKLGRMVNQFSANFVSSFGQGLANTFDLQDNAKSLSAFVSGKDVDFNRSFFGISTDDMQKWANGVAERNQIFEKDPGSVNLTDIGWWAKQGASLGTSLGMGIEALTETAAIEYATGGLGTMAAVSRLGKVVKNIISGTKDINVLKEGFEVARGMKSAATIYGIMNRFNESIMEASNTAQQIKETLGGKKDANGNPLYSDEELTHLASEGARRDYAWNMALLPLDILSYRTMVFNPISGGATNWIERGLEDVAGLFGKSKLGKAAGWLTDKFIGTQIEGGEEVLQQIGQNEGQHYAEVLGGLDDGSKFTERLNKDLATDEVWNNYAGGVLGGIVLGPAMNLVNKITTGNAAAKREAQNKYYIQNVGKMNSQMADIISKKEKAGDFQGAADARRRFNYMDTLYRKHSDAGVDKTAAFDSKMTFQQGVLDELNAGKTDALNDLGFFGVDKNTTPEQLEVIKQEFKNYIEDNKAISSIYDNVKGKYNANFVPTVTEERFVLHNLEKQVPEIDAYVAEEKAKLPEYQSLSDNGKKIHDLDYQVQSLIAAKKSLSRELTMTTDKYKRDNILKLIKSNEDKLNQASIELENIQKDENYDEKTKESDNDILNSKLHSNDYLQAVYDKETLENDISLQRKNVALWNDPKYLKQRTEQAIKNAKTPQQNDNNLKAATKNGKVDSTVEKKLAEKDAQLKAQKAADDLQKAKDQNKFGSQSLEGSDDSLNEFVSDIKQGSGTVVNERGELSTEDDERESGVPDSLNNPENIEASFSPKVYDFNKSPQEAKNKVVRGTKGLLDSLGDRNSFEDLINHYIKLDSKQAADESFEALKYGYRNNGNALTDEEAKFIYNKIFSNPLNEFKEGESQLIPQGSREQAEQQQKDIISHYDKPEAFDENNQPVWSYKGFITSEASPKLAYVSRLSNLIRTSLDEGEVEYEYTESELNTGQYVDSLPLLDPDNFNEGFALEIKKPTNYNDILVPVYLPNGMKGKAMPFGQWASERAAANNMSLEEFEKTQQYKDKIPLIIYKKGSAANEKGVAFVHDIGWYHPLRFNQDEPGSMKAAIEATRQVRQEVLDSNNNNVPATITSKRQTTFEGLLLDDDKKITLKEANPEIKLGAVTYSDGIILRIKDANGKDGIRFPNDETSLINVKPMKKGTVVDIRRYGTKDGKQTYVASPVIRSRVDSDAKNSVYQAITIYASGKDPKYKATVDHIRSEMGLDITTTVGLKAYLNHFIDVFDPDKSDTAKGIEDQAASKLAHSTPYIAFLKGGNIIYGQAGVVMYIDKKTNLPVYSRFINPNRPDLAANAIKGLYNPITVTTTQDNNVTTTEKFSNRLSWYYDNFDLENYKNNKPVITINHLGVSSLAAPSYHDYLMGKYTTNFKSYNIGTEEKPNWVSNIQPMITYDTNSRLDKMATGEIKTTEQTIQPKVEVKETEQENNKNEEIDADILKAIEEAERALGVDRNRANREDISKSMKVLTEEEIESIAEDIDRTAGLDSIEQRVVSDYIYNQIVSRVKIEKDGINRSDLDREVKKTLQDFIGETKKKDSEDIAHFEKMLASLQGNSSYYPRIQQIIADKKLRIAKANAIMANYKVFQEAAYREIAKTTSVTITREKIESPDQEEENIADKDTQNNADFYTDVMRDNPENKVTSAIRRFFEGVSRYDKQGNKRKDFLDIPLYTRSQEIIPKLMMALADVPADFDTMVSKLESLTDKYPWMNEVLGRLQHPSMTERQKNQFVTAMSHTSLRMKYTQFEYNSRTRKWQLKLMDSALNDLAKIIKRSWKDNLLNDPDLDLFLVDQETGYYLNTKKAESLIHKFESWIGLNVKSVANDLTPLREDIKKISNETGINVTLTNNNNLLQELRTNIVRKGDRMQFRMFNRNYQITHVSGDKYKIAPLSSTNVLNKKEEIKDWLKEFGIELAPKTLDVLLTKGLNHNTEQRSPMELFDIGKSNGLFGILYNSLKDMVGKSEDIDVDDPKGTPLDNSVITSLANLDSLYSTAERPFGFRIGDKQYFGLTAHKFLTDRNTQLKDPNSNIRENLSRISFSKNSMWLYALQDKDFREYKFLAFHDGAETMREAYKKPYGNKNGITDVSPVDHEASKVGKFQVNTQGQVVVGGSRNYPGTSIPMRIATMAGLTFSDKSIMGDFTVPVLDLNSGDIEEGLSEQLLRVLYEQLVKPELSRMISNAKYVQEKGGTDIENYDKGAGIFYFIPGMNNLEYAEGLKLVDAIKNNPKDFSEDLINSDETLKKSIYDVIKNHVDKLVADKIEVWAKCKFYEKTDNADTINFLDNSYMSKFIGSNEEKVRLAAMDYEINTLIANANNMMIFAGDPALYYKGDENATIDKQIRSTFSNVTKRLANQIAPGVTLPNSNGEQYLQIFLKDRKSISDNIEYLERLYGKDNVEDFRDIKGSDAQEYTTWKEHLNILTRLGKTPDFEQDITPEEIEKTRAILNSGKKLTNEQMELIRKVMQPIKPVYTGQIYDEDQDVMRTVYIKSSSFPLIPQLTKGFEIDKLRLKMEELENRKEEGRPAYTVRASYGSANKVGALANPANIWNKDGTINQDVLNNLEDSSMLLDRSNFRIQQEIPYKSYKNKADTITLGTQLMKILFGDGIMNIGSINEDTKEIIDGFELDGKKYTGRQLYEEYTNAFVDLIKEKQGQLYDELGLDDNGNPIDAKKTTIKLHDLLIDEAQKRGYPLQDIKALRLDEDGNFTLPLWSSANSNRYESILNSIVSKRMVALKLPGTSLVTGSEEGFISKKEEGDLSKTDKSQIIFTKAWNGTALQAQKHENGQLEMAQVFMPSKFRDNNGELVDLLTMENGKYKYITETDRGFELNEDMFDKELLSNLSFRIPTSGHQSGTRIEIAGFLPHTMGDLIIVPRNFTTQKGLDFDVDKENLYMLWHRINKDGKFEVLSDKHRDEYTKDSIVKKEQNYQKKLAKLQADLLEAGDRGKAKIEAEIGSLNIAMELDRIAGAADFREKLLHNKIIKITKAVYAHPSNEVQQKINKPLGTKYAEDQANSIAELMGAKQESEVWSPISSEYQKEAMISGASGKSGTGNYSLDVVFHSLAQQSFMQGKPIEFTSIDSPVKIFTFGKISSHSKLGEVNTTNGSRSISETVSERQNLAVDNASLGVLGKVNLNDITFVVDKVFLALGIDKGDEVTLPNSKKVDSIPFLFMSQPIIREYVERMKNSNSMIFDYNPNREAQIVNELIKKYDDREELPEDYESIMSAQMTNANFVAGLGENPDGKLQAAVLKRFMEMKAYGTSLAKLQTGINFKNNNLGKSYFDVIEKKNFLNSLGYSSVVMDINNEVMGSISGASNLIGDYVPANDIDQDRDLSGYTLIGDFYVKPNTVVGAFNIMAGMTAYNLWSNHFPYDSREVTDTFNQIFKSMGYNNLSPSKTIELKQEIFRHIKKYVSTSRNNGVIDDIVDVNSQRESLYIDSNTNTSLAMYIKKLMRYEGEHSAAVNRFIKSNDLLNNMEFRIKKDGTPSRIEYNNASGEGFDETSLYEALANMLTANVDNKQADILLPKIGNKQYTVQTLAQDLIAYCFLGNSTQEAIQFSKYVPVSYLNATGYSKWVKNNLQNSLNINSQFEMPENTKHLVSEMVMQYVQHNASKVRYKLDKNSWASIAETPTYNGKKSLENLSTFTTSEENRPPFYVIYNSFNKNKADKQQLYWFDGEKYTRIPVLGIFGMDEYQLGNGIGKSVVNSTNVRLNIDPQPSIGITPTENLGDDPFNIESNSIETVLDNISKSDITGYSDLAASLAPFIGNTTISVGSTIDGREFGYGAFLHGQNSIVINNQAIRSLDAENKARIVLEEITHSLTVNQIKPFIKQNEDGSVDVRSDAPAYVTSIVRLYNDIRSKVNDEKLQKVLAKVKAGEALSREEFNTRYAFKDIYEFMAQSFVNKDFQQYLSQEQFQQSGQTLLQRFKEIVSQILSKLGVKLNGAAAQAFNSVFEFIQQENSSNISKESKEIWDQSVNEKPPKFFDEKESDDTEFSANFPVKNLNIKEEKCI